MVVHGGSVPRRYPDWVREEGRQNAIEFLRACAEHTEDMGVPFCLENQPFDDRDKRHTVGPNALAETLDAVGVGPEALEIHLDVGHDVSQRQRLARVRRPIRRPHHCLSPPH